MIRDIVSLILSLPASFIKTSLTNTYLDASQLSGLRDIFSRPGDRFAALARDLKDAQCAAGGGQLLAAIDFAARVVWVEQTWEEERVGNDDQEKERRMTNAVHASRLQAERYAFHKGVKVAEVEMSEADQDGDANTEAMVVVPVPGGMEVVTGGAMEVVDEESKVGGYASGLFLGEGNGGGGEGAGEVHIAFEVINLSGENGCVIEHVQAVAKTCKFDNSGRSSGHVYKASVESDESDESDEE